MVLTAGCTRGDASEATLSVSDQTGDGQTLSIEEASADEPFYVVVEYDGGEVVTDTYEAGAQEEDLELTLDPALDESGTVEVAVHDEDDEQLTADSVEYDVEHPPEATLSVSDQRGGGQWLTVDEASASVDYYVDANYPNGEVASDTFDADTTQSNVRLLLAGVPGQSTEIEVALRSAETDSVLVSETVQYEEAASLVVESNSGEGDTMTIARAGAEVDYYVELEYSTVAISSETFEAGSVQTGLELELQPSIDTTRQVRVVVRDAETDEALTEQSAQYKYRGAVLNVDDQSGGGESLQVSLVEGGDDYYVVARYGSEESTSEVFPGGSVQRGVQLQLDPPIEESREVTVAVHAAGDDERLYDKTIQYDVS